MYCVRKLAEKGCDGATVDFATTYATHRVRPRVRTRVRGCDTLAHSLILMVMAKAFTGRDTVTVETAWSAGKTRVTERLSVTERF